MIALEGKRNKSNQIVNIIKKEFKSGTKTVIITGADSGAIEKYIDNYDADVIRISPSITVDKVIDVFETAYDEMFNNYDWVVFHTEAPKETFESFKQLDRKYPQNFVVTFHSDDSMTHKYYR